MVSLSAVHPALRLFTPLALLAAAVLLAAGDSVPATPGRSAAQAPREFVDLHQVDPTILREIRYATTYNFTGQRVDGYQQPLCLLTREAAEALHRAQQGLRKQGYRLKVYDCYRPRRAVEHFLRWADEPGGERMKKTFFPRVAKDQLFDVGFLAERSGHSRGSTVDLTLVRQPVHSTPPRRPGVPSAPCYGPRRERGPDNSVDMGTGFDCFDQLSASDHRGVGDRQRAHRELLRSALEREGFSQQPKEWWHFSLDAEPFPNSFFDFPVSRHALAHR